MVVDDHPEDNMSKHIQSKWILLVVFMKIIKLRPQKFDKPDVQPFVVQVHRPTSQVPWRSYSAVCQFQRGIKQRSRQSCIQHIQNLIECLLSGANRCFSFKKYFLRAPHLINHPLCFMQSNRFFLKYVDQQSRIITPFHHRHQHHIHCYHSDFLFLNCIIISVVIKTCCLLWYSISIFFHPLLLL